MSTERRHRIPGTIAAGLTLWAAAALPTSVPAAAAAAPPAPEPPVEAQAAQRLGEAARLVDRLLGDPASPVRRLDPAIFIELSPVTASEPAVRLPEDQRDGD